MSSGLVVACRRKVLPLGFMPGHQLPPLALRGYLTSPLASEPTVPFRDFTPRDVAATVRPRTARFLIVHVAMSWCGHCLTETDEQMALERSTAGAVRCLQILAQDGDGALPSRAAVDRWRALRDSRLSTAIEPRPRLTAVHGSVATFLLTRVDEDALPVLLLGEGGRPGFQAIVARLRDLEPSAMTTGPTALRTV